MMPLYALFLVGSMYLDNFKSFYASEAALTFVIIAYNLMSIFRMFVMQEKTQKTLTTLRYRGFAIGAYLQK
jgi:uncharacterized membrane protein YraQ (UPF0718 family)